MRIEPEPLIVFARVAEAGSVSAAAARLHRTQPALSAHLRKLTEAVGEPLYQRHRGGVRLTAAGEALLPYARSVASAVEGAQRWADELGGLVRGTLRLAASMTVAVYHLPPMLATFRRAHPRLRIELLTRNSAAAVGLLASGEADLAIVEGPVGDLPWGIEASLFGIDRLVLVVPPDHPLRADEPVPLEALEGLEVVGREPGSGTGEVVDRALAEAGVSVCTVVEATGLDAVKQAVLAGLGAGFLAECAVEREVAAGALREIRVSCDALVRPLTLLRRPAHLSPRAAQAMAEHLEAWADRPSVQPGAAVAAPPRTS